MHVPVDKIKMISAELSSSNDKLQKTKPRGIVI